jgi:ankyrin repeat protein
MHSWDILEKLANAGADLQKSDQQGWTPLHTAIANNAIKTISLLTQPEYKLNLNAITHAGETPVFIASRYNRVNVLELLLTHGADLEIPTTEGKTPLMEAVKLNCLETVTWLLEKKINLNSIAKNGMTACAYAATNDHLEIFKLLIKNKADIHLGNDGITPLFEAAENGSKKIMQELMKPEYKTNLEEINDSLDIPAKARNYTALIAAAARDQPDILDILLKAGADPYKMTCGGLTAMHWAAENDASKAIQLLSNYDYKIDINIINPFTGETPTYLAAKNNHLDILKILAKNKANLSYPNFKDMTPLHIAAKKGHINITQFLLTQKIDLYSQDKNKHTAFFYAITNEHWKITHLLLRNRMHAEDIALTKKYKKEIAWIIYKTSAYSFDSTGKTPIVRMLLQSSSLFTKIEKDTLTTNRHENSGLQREYDKRHGIVLYR